MLTKSLTIYACIKSLILHTPDYETQPLFLLYLKIEIVFPLKRTTRYSQCQQTDKRKLTMESINLLKNLLGSLHKQPQNGMRKFALNLIQLTHKLTNYITSNLWFTGVHTKPTGMKHEHNV